MKKALALILLAIIVLASARAVWAAACIDWPRVMAITPLEHQTKGPIVVVRSFVNFTKQKEDDWLTFAYRDFLADLLATGKKVRVRSGPTAKYDPAASRPNYIVSGLFQRTPGNLRVFIEVKNGIDGKMIKVIQMETLYPNNAEFFSRTAEAAQKVGDAIDISFNKGDFKRIRDATKSTQAFEYYHKGRKELLSYNPKKFDMAKIWFDQAKTIDFRSWLGYQGLIDLYIFQGLKAKQLGQPYLTYYQMADRELAQMQKLAKRPPAVPRRGKAKPRKKPSGEVKLTNRFLKGHAEYLGGMAAAKAGDMERAEKKFKEAVKRVPEDALAWQELARAYDRLGENEDAAKARQNARKVNSCI